MPYIEYRVLENVVEKLNRYYDCHGCLPDKYTSLVDIPNLTARSPTHRTRAITTSTTSNSKTTKWSSL